MVRRQCRKDGDGVVEGGAGREIEDRRVGFREEEEHVPQSRPKRGQGRERRAALARPFGQAEGGEDRGRDQGLVRDVERHQRDPQPPPARPGVDDFLAQATPEAKLRLIREEQAKGKLVAMCGDGTNDAPALAQADVGVAMQTGTNAAREAGNMVDLDSDPTKLIEIVAIGKQLLMTRGALTTFSIANDVAKYFAIIPAMFIAFYPQLGVLNVMGLATPQSAILSAIIFNALIIVALIPLALRGVQYRPSGAAALLRRNLLIYGIGGLVVPFVGIKLIDVVVSATGLA